MRRLALLLALFLPILAHAAITEVGGGSQKATDTGGTGDRTLAFPANVGNGNLVTAGGAGFLSGGAAAPTVTSTCTTGNWSIVSGAAFTAGRIFVAWAVTTAAGACTVTVDWANASTGSSFSIDEFTGQHGTPLDVDGGCSTGTSTTPSDSLTTLTADDLLLGTVGHDGPSGTAITPGTNYTQIGEQEDNTNQDHNMEFRIVTSAQAYTVDWTLGSSQPWGACTVGIKPAAGAPPAAPSQLPIMGCCTFTGDMAASSFTQQLTELSGWVPCGSEPDCVTFYRVCDTPTHCADFTPGQNYVEVFVVKRVPTGEFSQSLGKATFTVTSQ